MLLTKDLSAALDASAFARDTLGLELDPWQERVLTDRPKRLLMNVTRQGGKSTTASVMALHRSVFYPGSLALMVSPSLRQSGELFRKWRDLLHALETPIEMTQDTSTSATLANGSRVVSLPSSEATIRGFSAVDLLLFDEASRVPDELYAACRPMIAVSDGDIIAMSTPWGRRGWWYDAWASTNDWTRVEVPASEVKRISPTFLEEERRSLPPLIFKSEYECQFTETLDSVFSLDDISGAMSAEVRPLFGAAA